MEKGVEEVQVKCRCGGDVIITIIEEMNYDPKRGIQWGGIAKCGKCHGAYYFVFYVGEPFKFVPRYGESVMEVNKNEVRNNRRKRRSITSS